MGRATILAKHVLIVLQQSLSFLALLEIGGWSYLMLGGWPIYRFVACIVLVILWSNLASATARSATRQFLHAASMHTMKARVMLGTTAFLVALRVRDRNEHGR